MSHIFYINGIKPINYNNLNNMKTPIIILIALWIISLLLNAYMHGKEKTGKHNFFIKLVSLTIGISLLAWAGLFNL